MCFHIHSEYSCIHEFNKLNIRLGIYSGAERLPGIQRNQSSCPSLWDDCFKVCVAGTGEAAQKDNNKGNKMMIKGVNTDTTTLTEEEEDRAAGRPAFVLRDAFVLHPWV